MQMQTQTSRVNKVLWHIHWVPLTKNLIHENVLVLSSNQNVLSIDVNQKFSFPRKNVLVTAVVVTELVGGIQCIFWTETSLSQTRISAHQLRAQKFLL